MSMLPLTFMLPLIGFLILATMRDRLSEKAAAVVGVGSMGLAALCALMAGSDFLMNHPQGAVINQPLWTWMQVGSSASAAVAPSRKPTSQVEKYLIARGTSS